MKVSTVCSKTGPLFSEEGRTLAGHWHRQRCSCKNRFFRTNDAKWPHLLHSTDNCWRKEALFCFCNCWNYCFRGIWPSWAACWHLPSLWSMAPCWCKYNKWFHTCFFLCGAATQRWSWPPHSWGFLDHTQRCTTVGRTPLDEWSARCRDLYLTTHNTHNRQTSMPLVGFEPTISAGKQLQTYALDRAGTGTSFHTWYTS